MEASVILSVIGTIIALSSWYISDRRNKDRFEKELFDSFNSRYSELNQHLLSSYTHEFLEDCSAAEANAIIDYANICSEEYYWFRRKRISKTIWISWHEGMKYHYKHHKVFGKYWDKEMNDNKASYYMSEEENDFIKTKW